MLRFSSKLTEFTQYRTEIDKTFQCAVLKGRQQNRCYELTILKYTVMQPHAKRKTGYLNSFGFFSEPGSFQIFFGLIILFFGLLNLTFRYLTSRNFPP